MTLPPPYLRHISLPTPFAVGPVNVYLVEGDPLTLIDTGPRFEPARAALHKGLADLGYSPADLGQILITHAHSDHYGLTAELVELSGARVLTHASNWSTLNDYATERSRRLNFYASLLIESGVPTEVMLEINQVRRGYGRFALAVQPDGPLEDGASITLEGEEWHVLHTPGHSGGMICLHQPQRHVLLSSDHLLRDISSNPVAEPPADEAGERPRMLVDYVAQLQRIAALQIELALPGHGPPITEVTRLIDKRLGFHERRIVQVLAALQDTEPTVYEISLELFPHVDPINRFLAISEIIGHLDLLQAREQVTYYTDGPARRWRARDS